MSLSVRALTEYLLSSLWRPASRPTDKHEERLEEVRARYGEAVAQWCAAKAEEEGQIPSEERISKRVMPEARTVPLKPVLKNR